MGCHVFLQGIFLTQGSNPDLPHCRQIMVLTKLEAGSACKCFPGGTSGNEHACQCRRQKSSGFHPSREDPPEEDREPTSAFLPGEFHGHSPRGHKEWETTERLTLSLSFWGTKIPYAVEQLDGRATTTESTCHSRTPCTERRDPT